MRTAALFPLLSLLLLACGPGATGNDASTNTPCEPSCRSGFVCLRGMCVSACNPPCNAGETCTPDQRCVPATTVDAGEDSSLDTGSMTTDAMSPDANTTNEDASSSDEGRTDSALANDASGDSSSGGSDGGAAECARCGGRCVTPVTPTESTRVLAMGYSGRDGMRGADFAINPCTGEIGVVYARQLMSSENWEVYFQILPRDGTPTGTPTRVTTAPGPVRVTRVVWAGDRYALLWDDARHDRMPEACSTRCVSELYFAAFDPVGRMLVSETRLTTHTDGYAAEPAASANPDTGELLVLWTDSRTGITPQLRSALVSNAGVLRAERQFSETVSGVWANTPRMQWNGTGWTVLYRADNPDGARPDYIFARTVSTDGTVGTNRDLGFATERYAYVQHSALGHVVLAGSGVAGSGSSNGAGLRFFNADWTPRTSLQLRDLSTYDGSLGLAFDGASLWAVSGLNYPAWGLRRYNAMGVELATLSLTTDRGEASATGVHFARVGRALLTMWIHPEMPAGSNLTLRLAIRAIPAN